MAVNSFADKLVKKIFGSSSDIFLKSVKGTVQQIQDWEPAIEKMSDDELKAQTPKFKERIATALKGIDDKAARRDAEQECCMTFCQRRLRQFAKLRSELRECVISTCR